MRRKKGDNIADMGKVTAGYEEFIKGKQLNKNSVKRFNKALRKATTTKQRGSK